MSTRRLGVLGTIAAAAVALAAHGAYATGGGSNTGVAGIVYDNVTVGGITFTGSCEYSMTSRVTIAGHATAASATPVAATSVTCTVQHESPVPPTTSSSGWIAGPAAVTKSVGQLQIAGTAICITMAAQAADGSTVTTGQFCAS
jgi:hypothetical protein